MIKVHAVLAVDRSRPVLPARSAALFQLRTEASPAPTGLSVKESA